MNDTVDYWNFRIKDSLLLNYSYVRVPDEMTIQLNQSDLDSSLHIEAEQVVCGLHCWGCASILQVKNEAREVIFESEENSFNHQIPLKLFFSKNGNYSFHFRGGSDWDRLDESRKILFLKISE